MLLVVREPSLDIVQASRNAGAGLGLDHHPVGVNLADLPGDLAARIAPYLADRLSEHVTAVRVTVGGRPHDALLHRPPVGGLVVELEEAGEPLDLSARIDAALTEIVAAPALRTLCEEAARIFREIAGYDRVMVYRFDEEGHGEVIAEEREAHLDAYLNNRYPATDIPQIARRLYERNRVRMLVDVDYTPSPLVPRCSPVSGEDLDMSLCFLRSFSPIHLQYLKNMGVRSTLVISLMVGGRLWGLIACHHYQPRHVRFEVRTAAEFLAEAMATRIAALESFAEAQADIAVRRLEQRLVEAISRKGDWRAALFETPQALLEPMRAEGAALLFEGEVQTIGEVPGSADLRAIAAWLERRARVPVLATKSLGLDVDEFSDLIPVASGLVAATVSDTSGDYLMWFRPERVRTVTWGGNPTKPMVIGDDPRDLSPRRSFAQWHQVVEGTSEAWTDADLNAARLIGETVTDVVLQFRAVRTLIAQDQLDHVRRQVGLSAQPVVIAGRDGEIIFTNEAFRSLQPSGARKCKRLEDVAQCLDEPAAARRLIEALLGQHRSWRGEVIAKLAGGGGGSGPGRPYLVRADPIFSSPGRVLGFVLILTDFSERKAAELARRRFQEGILGGGRQSIGTLDSEAHLAFHTIVSSVVENAQLAALEIAEASDVSKLPRLLESIQSSVGRASDLLSQLLRLAKPRRKLH